MRRLGPALAVLLLAACAGAPPAPPPPPLVVAAPAPDPERAARLFDEAAAAQARALAGDAPPRWEELERRWREVVQAGGPAEARYNLGVCLEAQGRLDEARAAWEAALAEKALPQAAVNLAVLRERQGDAGGAARAYADVIRDHPEDAVARERLAALYRASGQLDEAWRQAREALLRDPTRVGAYKTMIQVTLARGDVDLGKLVVLRAQKVAPRDPELAFLAGRLLQKQGDDAAATAQFQRALALSERYAPARAALLEQAVARQAWPEVEAQARALLKDQPADASAQLALGVALRHAGKADEALAAYQQAEQLAQDGMAEVHLARGILLMRDKEDCRGALASFEAYRRAAGPVLPTGSPAPRLMRECQEQLEQARQAAEAARQMQRDAERTAAEAAARAAAEAAAARPPSPPPPAGGGAAPTSAPPPATRP